MLEYSDETSAALLLQFAFCFYFENSDRRDRTPQQTWDFAQNGLKYNQIWNQEA